MAPTLTRRKPKDALGEPINTAELYRPVMPFSATIDGMAHTVNGDSRLLGNHPIIANNPSLWIPASTDDATFRGAYNAAIYGTPPARHEPTTRLLKPIPPERRMVAVQGYQDRSGRGFDAGSIHDANDDFVQHNPDLFRKENDR